jgi:hypothetical protein
VLPFSNGKGQFFVKISKHLLAGQSCRFAPTSGRRSSAALPGKMEALP